MPTPASVEPTGISGPAALKPAEIESAVKSLAKAYKEAEKKSRDLFEEEEDPTAPEDDDMSSTTVATAESDEDQQTGTDEASAGDEDLFEPEPAFEDTHFDLVEEEDREIEAVAASLETDDAAEEREFFEETAAFESEDKAAETADADEPAEPKPTGQVIPLATVKPRVVPVDTSGLSRPERQAFRKIAEALEHGWRATLRISMRPIRWNRSKSCRPKFRKPALSNEPSGPPAHRHRHCP